MRIRTWTKSQDLCRFFGFLNGLVEEFIEFEKAAAQCGAIGGPFGFAGVCNESVADGGHFGVHVVHIVKDEGFADHGKFGRSEFVLAVMADQKMLDDGFEFGRKTFNRVHEGSDGFEFEDDVTEELTFGSVADGAVVAEFIELADVVEDGNGQQQVGV